LIPFLDFAGCELGILAGIPLEGGRPQHVRRITRSGIGEVEFELPLPTQPG
jgi:hypothetical protein